MGDLQFYNANEKNRSLCRKVHEEEWKDQLFDKHVREKMQIVEVPEDEAEDLEEVKQKRKEAPRVKAKEDEKNRNKLKLQSLCHLPPAPKPKKKTKAKAKSQVPVFDHGKTKAPRGRRKRG